jgi:4-amino-4-deoxy-L-arabinose transferase-like glycosyltransferase
MIFYILLFSFVFSLLASMYFFCQNKTKLMLLGVLLTSAIIRLFFIYTDDYLHEWDERFHALVAKNMMEFPFKPMLYKNPILENYQINDWCCNHIWLHKQPLFLWQMALSMKIFGVNTIALRLPSLLMGVFLTFPVYRIAKLTFNPEVAYFAVLLLALANHQIELISGAVGMDHNDMAFLCYTTCSIWAYYEYLENPQKWLKWVILIGLFSGAAILCKWLTGLLVYAGWGLKSILAQNKAYFFTQTNRMFLSLLVCGLVSLPWQLYTNHYFPAETAAAQDFNIRHIFEALENHKGSVWFHIQNLPRHYSYPLIFCIVAGLLFVCLKISTRKLLLLSYIFIIYLFFSLLVQTKVISYTYVVSGLIYILAAFGIDTVWEKTTFINRKLPFKLISLLILSYFNLQPFQLYQVHFQDPSIATKRYNTKIYKQINELVPADYVLFNCNPLEHVNAMFYADRTAYHWCMQEVEYQQLKAKGVKMAAFENHHNQHIPIFLRSDTTLIIVDKALK